MTDRIKMPRSPHGPAHKVTGLGCLSAAGIGIPETRRTFFGDPSETTGILDSSETHFFKLKIREEWVTRHDLAGPISGVHAANLFALLATEEALAQAGLIHAELSRKRIGICLGSTVGCTNYQEEFARDYNAGKLPSAEPVFDFFKTNTAQWLSRRLGCRGPVQMINNACTSGVDALGIAANWLDADLCDVVICGGTEVILSKIFYGFRSLMLCSPVACKPFDQTRQGLTLGEGAGIVILEKSDSPRRAQALLLGYGSGSDAFHPTSPHPEAIGLKLAARTAMAQAGAENTDISFINAHGTATPHNDLAEGRWIKQNLPHARTVATKGYTGHTLGAAGAIEAVFTVLSLIEQKLPSSRGFAQLDPEIGLAPTCEIESGRFEKALSLSLGFGGTNAAVCLGRAP